MDLLAVDSFRSNISVIINYLALTFLSEFYAVCVIKAPGETLQLNAPIPVITITVDSEFNRTFQHGVDNACQAFVVSEQAVIPYLDAFVYVHDRSDQRSPGKKMIVAMDSADVTKLDALTSHPNILDVQEVVFVCPDERGSIAFYTTEITNNGTRSVWNVRIVPVTPPNYFPDKFENMHGYPVRVIACSYPPFVYYEQSTPEKANARYDPKYMKEDLPLFLDGTEPILILEFCRIHNCTVEGSFDEVAYWGEVFENRTGTGLLGAVIERRADIAVAAVYYWRRAYDYGTYTHQMSRSGISVLVPKPRLLAPWRTPFLSFTGSLWIAVFAAFIVGTVAVRLIEGVRYKLLRPPNELPITLSDSLLTMIGFYMEQNARMRNDMVSCFFLFTSLLFAGFMVGNCYGGGLAGVMTVKQYEKPIDTTMDLAESGMPFVGVALSWIYSILYSTQPHVQTLVKNYRIVEEEYLTEHSKTQDVGFCMEQSEYGHFVPSSFLDVEASTMLQKLKDNLFWETVAALVTKTCPFKQPFNDLIMNVKQTGIQHFWELQTVNRYLITAVQKNIMDSHKVSGDDEVIALTVSHFLGAYLILAIGCGMAFVAFILEVVHSRFRTNPNNMFKKTIWPMLASNSTVLAAINYLALTYLFEFYAVCVIKQPDDDLRLTEPLPVIMITVDPEFNETFLQGVDNACQAFVVSERAFVPFIDSFVYVHDQSNQRAPGKRLIVAMESADVSALDRFADHPSMMEVPEVVFVCPDERNGSIAFYTIDISNNGTRSVWNVRIVPVVPPNYFPDKFKDMQGYPIRLSTLLYPPYAYYEQSTPEKANARYDPTFMKEDLPLFLDGTEPTLILEFCRIHNCTIEASFDESSFWGEVFDNRTGTGLLGAVVERRAEIAVAAIYFWRKPYDYASYTHHVSRSGITVLVPKPRLLAPWRTPFLSFTGALWLAVLIAFIVGTVAVRLIEGMRYVLLQPPNEMPITLSDSLLTMIGFYMEQSARMRTDMVSCVFLFTSLLFAGFMVGNSYGGGLAGVMTIPQYEKPIDTTMDLAASGMPYAGRALSWIFSILYASQPYVKTLVKNYIIVDEEYLVEHSKTHDLGYCGERTEFGHFVPSEFVDLEASTMLQLLKDDLYWETVAFLVTKTCPFKQPFNDLIMDVKQSGMQDYWELRTANRYLPATIQQNIWNARNIGGDDEVIKLTVSHFLGAYLILTFGCGMATLAFALEVWQTRIMATFKKIFKR